MAERNDGGPAFPIPVAIGPAGDVYCSADISSGLGMSLRDWFAGQAIVGLLSSAEGQAKINSVAHEAKMSPTRVACLSAYEVADAMLEARK